MSGFPSTRVCDSVPARTPALIARYAASTSVMISNVPGPIGELVVAGTRVRDVLRALRCPGLEGVGRGVAVATWVLRVVAVAWTAGVLVVVVGALAPRLPVVGFVGSFVTGQYPVHAALAAAAGVALGLGAWGLGAPGVGSVTSAVASAATVVLVVVLAAQAGVARREGARVDWWQALTVLDQPDGRPEVTAVYAQAQGADLRLDLYRPRGPGPHPVVVWAHGGSWVRGERDDRTALARWLAERGFAVVAVEYRLPPPAPVGEGQRRDLACALSWVAAEGARYDLDASAVTLAGQSAGATLALSTTAALVAGTLPLPGETCGPPPLPRAVVAYYPVTDLRLVDPSLQDAVLGGPARAQRERTRAASPVDLVAPGLPPTMLVMGSADHFVFPDRVIDYDRRLREAGVVGRLLVVPYADHVFDHPFGSPGAQATRPAVLRFLTAHGRG